MSLPTRPQQYCDPALLVFGALYRALYHEMVQTSPELKGFELLSGLESGLKSRATHFHKLLRPSVYPSVHPSVRASVTDVDSSRFCHSSVELNLC